MNDKALNKLLQTENKELHQRCVDFMVWWEQERKERAERQLVRSSRQLAVIQQQLILEGAARLYNFLAGEMTGQNHDVAS